MSDENAVSVAVKSHRGVDASRIGLVAHSEAGFVAPVVANRSRDVAFLIVTTASAVPMHRQVIHEVASSMSCDGFSETDVAKATALRQSLNESIIEDRNWDQLRTLIESASREKWFREKRPARPARVSGRS